MPGGVAKQAWWAWRKAEQLFDAAVQAEAAAARMATALAVFCPEGCLNDRQWAQEHIDAALPGRAARSGRGQGTAVAQ